MFKKKKKIIDDVVSNLRCLLYFEPFLQIINNDRLIIKYLSDYCSHIFKPHYHELSL